MLPKKNDIDPIIAEIHQVRRQIHEKFGGDILAIMKDAQQRQDASGRPVWKGPATSQEEQAVPSVRQDPTLNAPQK
jgi:hypothetical protein